MNNVDRTFPGQTFSKTQPVHGYDYDENGERVFTLVGEDLIYDRIQEANNSADMEVIKNQLLPAIQADENAVDKYFKSYGDIENLKVGDELETISNESIDDTIDQTQESCYKTEYKTSGEADETIEKVKDIGKKGGETK